MLYNLIGTIGFFLLAVGLLADLTRRTARTTVYALMSAGATLAFFASAALGHRTLAVFFAVSAGLFAWLWWHSGGGDGTKRRLRRLAGRFHSVRRTAPAGAS